jgi:hypothetical protein
MRKGVTGLIEAELDGGGDDALRPSPDSRRIDNLTGSGEFESKRSRSGPALLADMADDVGVVLVVVLGVVLGVEGVVRER